MARKGKGGSKQKGGGGGKGKKAGGSKKSSGRSGSKRGSSRTGGEKETKIAPQGLTNIGNTCFFNSVLQNLITLKDFNEVVLNDKLPTEGKLSSALQESVRALCQKKDGKASFNPGRLFNEIGAKNERFKGRNQQDAHELFRFLLNGLIEEERENTSSLEDDEETSHESQQSQFEELFGGTLKSSLSCSECGHESFVTEPFLDLTLAMIPKQSRASMAARRSPSESPVEKKKKMYPSSASARYPKQRSKKESYHSAGKKKRGRASDSDGDYDYTPPESMVSSQEPEGTDQSADDGSGNDVIPLFDHFDLSDGKSDPSLERGVTPAPVSPVEMDDDGFMPSLFDDVEEISTPESEEAVVSPLGDAGGEPEIVLKSESKRSGSGFASLVESLESFLDMEVLDGDNKPICEVCTKRLHDEMKNRRPSADCEVQGNESEKNLESFSECSDTTVGTSKSPNESLPPSEVDEGKDEVETVGSEPVAKNVYRTFTKKYRLTQVPKVLVFQLNRFSSLNASGTMRKINGTCDFPLKLDMKDIEDASDGMYRLSGVVCHSGSLRWGHYVAYVRRDGPDGNDLWFWCSDSTVQEAKEDDVLSSEPYLLFYEQN